jgi:hypothetical protein
VSIAAAPTSGWIATSGWVTKTGCGVLRFQYHEPPHEVALHAQVPERELGDEEGTCDGAGRIDTRGRQALQSSVDRGLSDPVLHRLHGRHRVALACVLHQHCASSCSRSQTAPVPQYGDLPAEVKG